MEPACGAECMRCRRRKEDVKFDADYGYVCKRCYFYASSCTVPGCTDMEAVNGLCRNHFLDDDWTDEDYRSMAEHLGFYPENRAIEPDPGAGYGRLVFGDVITEKMREKGIPGTETWFRPGISRKDRYYLRKNRGDCVECGKRAVDGKTKCQACILRKRNEDKTRRQRRMMLGQCVSCGKKKEDRSKTLCSNCVERNKRYKRDAE